VRIALLVTDLQPGGTPLRLARLATSLVDKGVEVHAGCLAEPGPVSERLRSAGIPVFACDARSARSLPALVRLRRHLARIKPDLVHATLTHANVAARIVGRSLAIPVIGSTATIEIQRRGHLWLERRTAWLDRAHIVNSRAVADHVEHAIGLARNRIRIVPPSIDPIGEPLDREQARAACGIPPGAFLVLWVGRFDPVKRLETLIDCAAFIDRPEVVFALVGDGAEREPIMNRAKRNCALHRFIFPGWQNDVDPWYAAADVFTLPSRTEGVPNAALRAMMHGIPVVASDIPSSRELAGGADRLVIAEDEAPSAYAATIMRLQQDVALRDRIGANARRWALESLRPEATVLAAIAVYEKVLAAD
jgi:glycosyltransferase involved in cell wall biosynthesis